MLKRIKWREQANSHPIRPGQIISETHSSLQQRGGRGKGAAAPFPCTPNPRPTSSASLRTTPPGPSRLTKPNTSCTIITPASLRSDCCSPSLRNAVRLPSGIDVHLHRNTHHASEIAPQRLWIRDRVGAPLGAENTVQQIRGQGMRNG